MAASKGAAGPHREGGHHRKKHSSSGHGGMKHGSSSHSGKGDHMENKGSKSMRSATNSKKVKKAKTG